MTRDEIQRIQKELGVDLPAHYAIFLLKFEGVDNPEFDLGHLLYSSAEHLIVMNKRVGFYLSDKIIKNKLIIGDNGGGDYYLIDLVDKSDETVYVFDHEETVENCFDKVKRTFDWDKFDKYDTVDSYRASIQEMFE
ncbi:MAG: SMI1/KNR4 family protein [Cyclobacteriaceae bacterium]|nr:SMI1/KNR4 family protein [Cyclobacteriaceae bacterium]